MLALKKKDGGALLALCSRDSLVDMTEGDLTLPENISFWKVKGEKDCYVCTGSFCFASDVLRYNSGVFKGVSDTQSVIKSVVPKMKALLAEYGLISKDNRFECPVFIIKGDNIFKISPFFTVSQVEKHAGYFQELYITGALDTAAGLKDEDALLFAVRSAQALTCKQWFPLVMIDTKTKKQKIYYK